MLAYLALLVQFAAFFFENWYLDACLFLQVAFVTLNLCIALLPPDSMQFWLDYRQLCVYIPYGLILCATLVELIVFGSVITSRIEREFNEE